MSVLPDSTFAHRSRPAGVTTLAVLGATGSIGKSALEVVRQNPGRFTVYALSGHSRVRELAALCEEFRPRYVVLSDTEKVVDFRSCCTVSVEVLAGEEGLCEVASAAAVDVVLAAVVGMAGLPPVLAALNAGKVVALANKESLVAGAELVKKACRSGRGYILPVDSEHSAMFQAMQGAERRDIAALVLTASGGPFLNATPEELAKVTPAVAIRHPRWNMGPKISVDSATLVNKALELIEAHHLFEVPEEKISVLVHPQSIVHSLVEFGDGTMLAQLSVPDMKGPIAYALSWPHGRLAGTMERLSLAATGILEFRQLDTGRFPAVRLARECLEAGLDFCAAFNWANELAVAGFLAGRLTFNAIVTVNEAVLGLWKGRERASLKELLGVREEVGEIFARVTGNSVMPG